MALAHARRFISEDKVDFLMGPTSSGLAMALTELARQEKKILVATQAAADSLTGKKLHPYIFSTLSNAMMQAGSGAYVMASSPYKRYMVVGPDYSYGHSSWEMFKSKLMELRPDVEIVGELFPKFLAKDYSAEIKRIQEVKFAFPCAGALEVLVPMGKDMPEGILVSSRYFFTSPGSSMNRDFVKAYRERFKGFPDYMAGETYAGIYFIKAAVERAGSVEPEEIIRSIEKEPLAWETPEGWKIMRAEDHSVLEDCLRGETSYNQDLDFSMPETFESIQAENICRTDEELSALPVP